MVLEERTVARTEQLFSVSSQLFSLNTKTAFQSGPLSSSVFITVILHTVSVGVEGGSLIVSSDVIEEMLKE